MSYFPRLIGILLLVSLISCVETKASTDPISSAFERDVNPVIAQCEVNGFQISVSNTSVDNFELRIVSKDEQQTVKITPESFDGPPTITIECKPNGFNLVYEYQVGNSYHWYTHVFMKDAEALFMLTSTFTHSSDRNGIALLGTLLESPIAIKDYSGIVDEAETELYQFTGFQEGEEPEITPFYERVKASKEDKKTMKLLAEPFVVDYMLDVITTENTVSQLNDIAYYFEQAGFFDAAISLLTELISSNPKRTVAYINLGDAYWGLQKVDEAKEAYNEYVGQMIEKGLEAKIPERVNIRLDH